MATVSSAGSACKSIGGDQINRRCQPKQKPSARAGTSTIPGHLLIFTGRYRLCFFLKMFYLFYHSPRDRWFFYSTEILLPSARRRCYYSALLRTGKGPRKRVTTLLSLLFFGKLTTLKIKTPNKLQKKKMKSVVCFLCLIVLLFQIFLVFYFLFPSHLLTYLPIVF